MDRAPHALITGASAGFGLALTDAFLARRWHVTTVCRTRQPTLPNCTRIVGDLTDPHTPERVEHTVGDRAIDVLINNAGVTGGGTVLSDVTREHLEHSYATNVVAPLEIARACHHGLADASQALVVNVSSRLASLARQAVDHYGQSDRRSSYAYRITKAGQNMLSLAMAHELAQDGVAVWALHPGRLTTRLGLSDADMTPEDAATTLIELMERRDRADTRPRFISLDTRETDGGDLPW